MMRYGVLGVVVVAVAGGNIYLVGDGMLTMLDSDLREVKCADTAPKPQQQE